MVGGDRFDWLEVDKAKPREGPAAGEEAFGAKDYLQRAERAYRRGDYEFALRQYGKSLREDAACEDAWLGQVLCLTELGELEEARVWVNKALERIPESALLLSAKAVVLAGMGDMGDAMTISDRAIQKKDPPHLVWLHRWMVLLHAPGGRTPDACLGKALEGSGQDGHAALRAGMELLRHGDLVAAKKHLARAADADAENPLAWYKLGRCCEELGACGRAQACFERALNLKPEFKDKVVEALGRLARRGFFSRLAGGIRGWWRGD